ncbi:hypothetical protein PHYPO_G00174800 [Pangasianodon hypophthalmus]|uniref:Secretory calcium-binding phosphoprotein 1 n=1 Tax=Pangasianodon hypophthalmus TaxID=310915 RepID=A0A5N5PP77_PANHP|nr:hypothetical protein PHYPO_G00174800 [Pangasianodon hypophthalmus]
MKLAFVILCLLGAASANPILHKVAMDMMEPASNSTSSMSESTEETNAIDQDSSQENTSEDTTSESMESKSSEQTTETSQSHSLEERFGTGEAGMTVDNSQGSTENMRKNWIRVFSPQEISSEDNSTSASLALASSEISKSAESQEKKSNSISSSSESNESTEGQGKNSTNSSSESSESNSIENKSTIDSNENSAMKSSNSSSSESHESTESTKSTESKQSHSDECQPGADSQDCDSDEYVLQNVGDDGASDPFNGFHVPDSTEREVAFKR